MRMAKWMASAVLVAGLASATSAATNTNVTFGEFKRTAADDPVQIIDIDGRQDVIRFRSEGYIQSGVPVYDTLAAGSAVWLPENATTWSQVTRIEADYKGEIGIFGGGTPRFYVGLDLNGNGAYDSYYDETLDQWVQEDGHIFIYWGSGAAPWVETPSYDWEATGNYVGDTAVRFETGQLPGGTTAGTTYAETISLYGDLEVVAIGLAVDGGWFNYNQSGGTQDVQQLLVDQIHFEGTTAGGTVAFAETLVSPEPTSLALLVAGAGLILVRRRRTA